MVSEQLAKGHEIKALKVIGEECLLPKPGTRVQPIWYLITANPTEYPMTSGTVRKYVYYV